MVEWVHLHCPRKRKCEGNGKRKAYALPEKEET